MHQPFTLSVLEGGLEVGWIDRNVGMLDEDGGDGDGDGDGEKCNNAETVCRHRHLPYLLPPPSPLPTIGPSRYLE